MKKLLLLAMLCCVGTVSAQQLQFKETRYNFGERPRTGGNLVHDFEFTNTGDAPLVIVSARTTCTCTKVDFVKKPVMPGEKGVVRVTYEPHKIEAGTFSKVIQIHSNSKGGRELLTVSGVSVE